MALWMLLSVVAVSRMGIRAAAEGRHSWDPCHCGRCCSSEHGAAGQYLGILEDFC